MEDLSAFKKVSIIFTLIFIIKVIVLVELLESVTLKIKSEELALMSKDAFIATTESISSLAIDVNFA